LTWRATSIDAPVIEIAGLSSNIPISVYEKSQGDRFDSGKHLQDIKIGDKPKQAAAVGLVGEIPRSDALWPQTSRLNGEDQREK